MQRDFPYAARYAQTGISARRPSLTHGSSSSNSAAHFRRWGHAGISRSPTSSLDFQELDLWLWQQVHEAHCISARPNTFLRWKRLKVDIE